MIHNKTNMPARSGCGLIKADQALLGGINEDTTSEHVN